MKLHPYSFPFRITSRSPGLCAGVITVLCGGLQQSLMAEEPGCVPAPEVVAWWQAEENPADQQGAHDGMTPFGIAYAPGVVGAAFDFDGSQRRVTVADSPAFHLTNAMTLEAWVYPRAYQGFITFRGDNRGGLDTWTLDVYEAGLVKFQIDDESNNYAAVRAPMVLNQWQHVAATWDRTSGDLKLYIDGTLASQTNTSIIPIGVLDAEGAVGIGNHGGTFHQFPFNGLIDELAIYSRALATNEIAAIYHAGSAGKCYTNPPPPLPPSIVSQPTSQTNKTGSTVRFEVIAAGTEPLRYQWERSGQTLFGATNASLVLSMITSNDAANYRVIVTNPYGGTKSLSATLKVLPASVCVPVPDGAVAWWPGESNTWDVVGGFDGSVYQSPPPSILYPAGLVGSAFRCNPGWSFLAPAAPELDLGRGQGFTFEGWINPDTVSGTYGIFGWGGSGPGAPATPPGVNLRILNPGILQAYLVKTNNQTILLQTVPLAVQARLWQHVALSCDTATGDVTIQVNGLPVAHTNLGPVRLLTSGTLRLGNAAGPMFYGLLDEPTLYNRALTPSEIKSIVTAEDAGKCPPPPPPCVTPPVDIAGWWRGESNTVDSVAGNTGLLMPTNFPLLATYQAGVRDAAFSFKGPNYVSVPAADILDVGKAEGLTIEAWINPNQYRSMPLFEWTDTNNFGVSLWMSYYLGPSVLEANLIDTSGGFHRVQSPTRTLTYNAWQHVALTYDKTSGQAVLYVNGSDVATTNAGTFTPRTDTDLLLGFHPRYTGMGGGEAPPYPQIAFTGSMDEVAIYRRALSALEIRAIAQSHPGKCLELSPTIGRQPRGQVALEGGTVTLDVAAGGTEPFAYQWYFEGAAVQHANSPVLVLARSEMADAGRYSVVVSNAFGSVTSRVAVLTILPVNQCLPAPLGVVSLWRGESNVVDEVGGHDAQWGSNTPEGFTNGLVGEAFRFPGFSFLEVPAHPDLDVAAGGGFTVEGWIKPDFAPQAQAIVDWNDGRGNVGVGLMLSGPAGPGGLQVTLTDTNALSSLEGTVTFATPLWTIGSPTNPIPGWTHVAMTFEKAGGNASLFVNGQQVANRAIAPIRTRTLYYDYVPFTPATSGDLYLGWRRSGTYSGPRFRGAMDEMTVYHRALTPLEIQAIYVVGSNGKCSPQPPVCLPPAEGIVGWWRGESNAMDSVLGNFGLMYSSSQGGYTSGRVGTAFATGTRQYVFVRSPAGLDVGAGPGLSVEAWINPSLEKAGSILSWASPSGVSLDGPSVGLGNLRANLRDTTGLSRFVNSPSGVVKPGRWQHVALTYDHLNGWAALYVNGVLVTSTNVGIFMPDTRGSVQIGAGSAGYFYGAVDEAAVYGRALTPFEVAAIYHSAKGRCTEPPVIVKHPESLRVNRGSDVTFNVEAIGNPVLSYSWRFFRLQKATILPPQSNSGLNLTNVQDSDEGSYWVLVTNAFGVAKSMEADLLVNYPPVADAGDTLPIVISANHTDAAVVLDGSLSSDTDGDQLDYTWYSNGEESPLATGVVAVVILPVGTHPVQLVVADGLLAVTNAIIVQVITPAQAVENLIAAVRSADLDHPQSLIASLSAAIASLNRTNPTAAINQLQAFQNKVRAQVAPQDQELAGAFIQQAQEIIDILSGGGLDGPGHGRLVAMPSNGKIKIDFQGSASKLYLIEASCDMVHWEKIGVAKHRGNGQFDFEDPKADKFNCRYYRIVAP